MGQHALSARHAADVFQCLWGSLVLPGRPPLTAQCGAGGVADCVSSVPVCVDAAVNGYMYGNLPGLDMCAGKPIAWHVLGLGSEADIHGVYFQGNIFRREGTTRDTLSVFPHTSVTVHMEPHKEGKGGGC